VKLDSFEHRWSNFFAGTYDRYHNRPEANGRAVYQHRDERSYCMWHSGTRWIIGNCPQVGSRRGFIFSAERTERNCMVGISSWEVSRDPMTLTLECDYCCPNVELISTNSDVLDSWYGKNLLGAYNYQKNHAHRYVYKKPDFDACLYYEGRQWRVGECANIGKDWSWMITTAATNNRMCVTSAHGWKIFSPSLDKDSTMHVKCNDNN